MRCSSLHQFTCHDGSRLFSAKLKICNGVTIYKDFIVLLHVCRASHSFLCFKFVYAIHKNKSNALVK